MKQAPAVRKAIGALNLKDEHAGLRAFCIGIAEQIDEHPERATLWREYLPALNRLLEVGEVATDDGQAALLRLVSTPLGNAEETEPEDVGAGGGGAGKAPRSAPDAVAGTGRGRRSRAAS